MRDELVKIKDKLSTINKYWNDYYLSRKFFQKKINFTDDVKTNYYGDLNNYFNDTLTLIKPIDGNNSTEQYISYFTVLLQTIFVHQDLIDELLYIFKLDRSSKEDKNPNRTIRNELIGHPISKCKKNELQSSVLLDIDNFDNQTINYHRYSKENKFIPEKQSFEIDKIINDHINFIDNYLDKIIQKCKKEIIKYNKEIKKIVNIPLEKQFNFIEIFEPNLLSSIENIFLNEYLEYYYKNIRKHRRYLYCLKNYKETLLDVVCNRSCSFEEGILNDKYTIEKLYAKHMIFNVDFYIKRYKDNHIIYKELLNMKDNINNDKEYYASLNYLTYKSRSKYHE
jgi:hypothetical protein